MTYYLKQEDCVTTPDLIVDYLIEKKKLKKFYNLFPSYKNLIQQADVKLNAFKNRHLLLEVLYRQFQNNIDTIHIEQQKNLNLLSQDNTVTITCGHQLNLLTGPIYVLYKILQTIKLSNKLNQYHNKIHFVPVFWLANEDHDFLEINYFYFKGEKWLWEGNNDINVGSKSLKSLLPMLEKFIKSINLFPYANNIISLIEKSYFSSENLNQATYKLINLIFGSYGLINVDSNCIKLKKILKPVIEEEFSCNRCFKEVSKTNEELKKLNYKIQVNPRKINLFELNNNQRVRIDNKLTKYSIQKISPNVLIRPIYQELILPNIAYIGGYVEISYWLQLKSYFNYFNIPFPIIIPRNSCTIINYKQKKKLNHFGFSYWDLLNSKNETIKKIILDQSTISIDFDKYSLQIHQMYEEMIQEAEKVEKTLKNLLLAQRKKQLNQFDKIKKRILKIEKNRQNQLIKSIENFYNELFPYKKLQERSINFLEFYIEYPDLITLLYNKISAIDFYFHLLYL